MLLFFFLRECFNINFTFRLVKYPLLFLSITESVKTAIYHTLCVLSGLFLPTWWWWPSSGGCCPIWQKDLYGQKGWDWKLSDVNKIGGSTCYLSTTMSTQRIRWACYWILNVTYIHITVTKFHFSYVGTCWLVRKVRISGFVL